MGSDSGGELQHPRRNLGNSYRSQAEKFVKLARKDTTRSTDNLHWAEQNALQAILYDFTDERNWQTLAHIKKMLGDGEGLGRVLDDVFTILGRDPENLQQLHGLDMLEFGIELLAATIAADPLDADLWWDLIQNSENDKNLADFSNRCRRLDFRDQRANIIFGRRLERVLKSGRDDLFIELVQHLLAHRPGNHELWLDLGRLHEGRKEWEQAWLCYDHVQQLIPHSEVRDAFRIRLTDRMDGEWSVPELNTRNAFLQRMQELAESVVTEDAETVEEEEGESEQVNKEEVELIQLLNSQDYPAAFFLARRLVANGEEWAGIYLEQARAGVGSD